MSRRRARRESVVSTLVSGKRMTNASEPTNADSDPKSLALSLSDFALIEVFEGSYPLGERSDGFFTVERSDRTSLSFQALADLPAARIPGPPPRNGRGPLGRFRPQPTPGIEPRDRGSTRCAQLRSDLRRQLAPHCSPYKSARRYTGCAGLNPESINRPRHRLRVFGSYA